ncbi:phospholipid-transporting ATPase ABCA3 isoform X2 [Eurosta solidaginis]|uniref:phospholipid-transporting ATPase ABCA3 isoform X2 n=1 Tax=Eurosta solidaginis TaxID=178769 RepID=UPI003531344F
MSETIRLFRVFLWKNWKQIRCTWISLLSILIGCAGILNIYLYSTSKLLITPQTTYETKDFNYLKSEFPTNSVDRIFYSPSTIQTATLMDDVRKELQYSTESVISFDNSTEMIRVLERDCKGNCYAVDFHHYPMDVSRQKLQYSICSTIIRISPKKRYVNDEEVAGIRDDDDYIRSGFITLQHSIDKTYIKLHNGGNIINFDFEIAPMPMIAQETIDSQRIIWFGSLYSILFNVLLLSTFLVPVVEEKQNGIKEFLAIATPMDCLNGISFFLIRLMMYAAFTMVILIAGLIYHAFSEIVPIVYIIILFGLYILSSMCYTYLISVFFHSVFHAKVGGLLLLVMPYILFFSKGSVSTVANIFSTKTFMEGIRNFQIFTNKYREVGPSVLNINITETSFTVLTVYSIQILQCLIYIVLYNYLSYISPGSVSFKRPYLLPFMVRGMLKREAHKIKDELLIKLKLQDKENELGNCLSGGMKRRLSLGIAIAGNTKVIILDEPSSGLDIESRRELWDILLKLRKIKAVLITTHHMDEAEVLGDTIAILANGRVHCTGSPLELKRKIGRGYVLKLSITDSKVEQAILQIIQQDIPEAQILTIVPPAMHISLPYENISSYSSLLQQIERRQKQLGINAISMADASLEDVFLNCLSDVDVVDGISLDKQTPVYVQFQKAETRVYWTQHLKAIFYKKYIFIKNKWTYSILMVIIPIICLVVALTLMHSMSLVTREDKLALNLEHIQRGTILISGANSEIVNILKREIGRYDGIKVELLTNNRAENITDLLTSLQYENLAYFLENYIGAIDVIDEEDGGVKFNVYFSGNIYHSSVILMNLLDDSIARRSIGFFGGIGTTYLPIRRYITDVSPTRLEYYAVIMPIGLFFNVFFYIALPFYEHANGFKQLQAVPRLVYWFSSFAFDATLHFTICLLLALLQVLLMPNELYNLSEQFFIITSIFFYGVSYLPILYSLANAFRSISTISTYMLFMLTTSAIIPLITSGSVRAMEYHEGKIFILKQLPDFNLNHQMRIINERFLLSRRSQLLVSSDLPAVLSVNTFFFESILIWVITMAIFVGVLENKYKCEQIKSLVKCYKCRWMAARNTEHVRGEDDLVANENTSVGIALNDKSEKFYPLLVHDLYKLYNHKTAVCGLNFTVEKQECFGLLGINGAGKTSTFEMISANRTITRGTIKIYGIDIIANETEYRYRFGYCPQTDCLNEFMTAYQVLYYMAKLRGISNSSRVNNEVLYWLQMLDIERYKDVEVRQYSGGTKRKLSAALAMIGSPSLILLDEPTTGVDPESRRFLWKCIKEYQSREKTVVLTSHSMDECEHLCNRLAIMTGGKFKWSGHVPDLKKEVGTGFTIKIKLKSEEDYVVDGITEELEKLFTDCELRENHAGTVTYFIKNIVELKWSDIFEKTQVFSSICSDFFEDYSVNETTLEDIFLKFGSNKRRACIERQNDLNDV